MVNGDIENENAVVKTIDGADVVMFSGESIICDLQEAIDKNEYY